MNKVSKRAWVVSVLVLAIIIGIGTFLYRYFRNGREWATFFGSPHLYYAGSPTTGEVIDRSGILLLDTENGRTYTDDLMLRESIIHILGDRYGYIAAPLLSNYMDSFVTYNSVAGLNDTLNHSKTAVLTISAEAQKAALDAMGSYRGTVGVYNYKTGEILCLVTTPTYDPDNVPDIEGDTTGAFEGAYINRFFKSTYTPGSIFKVITLTAALENIDDLQSQTFLCEGTVIVGGELITCSGTHGTQTLEEAFRNSCNCAFAAITTRLDRETLTAYVKQAGLIDSDEIDGITVKAGSYHVDGASEGSFAWSGIGQYTDQITPCSYMVFMGMIANGGVAAKPYLMAEISSESEASYRAEAVMVDGGISEKTANLVAMLMRRNVELKYGTSMFPDVAVCAKSGTAETTEGKEPNAMFAGFVLDDDYPLAFIVVVEEGGYGTAAAAPIAGKVLQACMDAMDE